MTLAGLAAIYPYAGCNLDGCRVFPYVHDEPRFWHLSDYAVSSVVAGSIYLVPRLA